MKSDAAPDAAHGFIRLNRLHYYHRFAYVRGSVDLTELLNFLSKVHGLYHTSERVPIMRLPGSCRTPITQEGAKPPHSTGNMGSARALFTGRERGSSHAEGDGYQGTRASWQQPQISSMAAYSSPQDGFRPRAVAAGVSAYSAS